MPLQLLVAGGGIGGLASALALAQAGHGVEVLEQSPVFAEVGAGIQLGPNAVRRLQMLGLADALDAIAARPEALVVRSARNDDELACLPLGKAALHRYGAPYCCVHRADLHGVLLAAAQAHAGIVLNHSARLAQIALSDEAVAVVTDSAHAWEGDALIGADGLWSTVRDSLPEAGDAPRSTGHTAWRGLLAQSELPAAQRSTQVRVWLGDRLHALVYPLRGGELLNVVVLAEAAPTGDARDWDQSTSLGALQRATGRCCATLQGYLAAVPTWRAWTLHDRKPLTGPAQMAHERIALVGDAAHPMLPYLAQGAGMAIEDAVALADSLRDVASAAVAVALQRYAAARWQRNAQVQARALRNADIFHAAGPLRLGRDLAMRLLGARLLDQPWLFNH
ncbi:FAD-dependent monooxygenase [Variovorax ginsengisoli]|uniref:Salicylate hydroxylase n=1 Tax=Variovorax ginsengisoli TaxID=363844 RepID=A0ABT9S0I2_9BURK|nr:FAD-dependent monooxygenase [Variovorax ginsengisoli]MDP9897861.1 salicylate hydroxylase [Variovorax ginsengisoli]